MNLGDTQGAEWPINSFWKLNPGGKQAAEEATDPIDNPLGPHLDLPFIVWSFSTF